MEIIDKQHKALSRHSKKITKTIHDQANLLRSKFRKVVTGDEKKRIRDRIRETQEEPKYVKFFDKLAFTAGVMNMGICQYFLLNRPDLFPLWYALVVPVMLISRYIYFHGAGWQYFMIDFCYFTLFNTMVNVLLVRNSALFFKVSFICSTGPLMLAIPVWRNSFVFHDYDKIVSVYIHILPGMLYYTLRWHNGYISLPWAEDLVGAAVPGTCEGDCANCMPLELTDYLATLLLYVLWQMAYLLKTEWLDKSKLDRNPSLLTSLRWMSSDTKNAANRAVLRLLRRWRVYGKQEEFDSKTLKTKGVFVITQLLFTLLSFLPTYFMYHSATFHLLYILLIVSNSVFNGASFYIEVFSKRYNTHIVKIEEMHRLTQAASQAMKELSEVDGPLSEEALNPDAAPSPIAQQAADSSALAESGTTDWDMKKSSRDDLAELAELLQKTSDSLSGTTLSA
ncbi:hypothetical protein B484DRAFT_335398 [Ochromonadaceae sp. CCMP2298]|nr:hypothetical protein B484DRAFT_335398 [Ochromonadaceae sp. CCMP2298]|mmetsp:Transcript_2597/g.5478  ORF Transcript_2597/g.5478 Transcript_2597/m.5478 type:complete len:451 (+) Transcript_2597:216-1568(+)